MGRERGDHLRHGQFAGGRQPEPSEVCTGLLPQDGRDRELLLPERFVPLEHWLRRRKPAWVTTLRGHLIGECKHGAAFSFRGLRPACPHVVVLEACWGAA